MEGFIFVPRNIVTENDLLAWIHLTLPLLTDDDIEKLLVQYSNDSSPQQRADVCLLRKVNTKLSYLLIVVSGYLRRNNICLPKLLAG